MSKSKILKSSLVRNAIVLACSLLIGGLFNLPWGGGAVLDFVTGLVFFAIITLAVGDVWYKVLREKWKLTWQYWIGIVLTLLATWAFLWASKSVTWPSRFIRLGVTAGVGLGSGLWFLFAYKPVVEARNKAFLEEYKAYLQEQGVSAATADAMVRASDEDAAASDGSVKETVK